MVTDSFGSSCQFENATWTTPFQCQTSTTRSRQQHIKKDDTSCTACRHRALIIKYAQTSFHHIEKTKRNFIRNEWWRERERERERERGGERDVRASFWNWPIKINVQIQSEMLIFLIWISIEFCNSAAASRLPSRWLSIINFPWFIFVSFEKVLVSKVAKNPLRISFDHISSPVIVRIISAHLHSRLDYFNLLIDSSVFLFAWLTH